MGYTTYFKGEIVIDNRVDKNTKAFLDGLCSTRRMRRNPEILAKILGIDYLECLQKYGEDAKHYFEDSGNLGQSNTEDVINYNHPPANQPGLWCNWCLGEDERSIVWNGGEKFYSYVEWMKYIVDELVDRGYNLTGDINWEGEDECDTGTIMVRNNIVDFTIN